jgi:hypothetical protein
LPDDQSALGVFPDDQSAFGAFLPDDQSAFGVFPDDQSALGDLTPDDQSALGDLTPDDQSAAKPAPGTTAATATTAEHNTMRTRLDGACGSIFPMWSPLLVETCAPRHMTTSPVLNRVRDR